MKLRAQVSGCQAQPGREVPARLEAHRIRDECPYGGRYDGTHAWDGHQPACLSVLPGVDDDLTVELLDLRRQGLDLLSHFPQGVTSECRQARTAISSAPSLCRRPGQKRGVFGVIKRELRRRSAIEPLIGHMKHEGHLGRCDLKGRVGDAANILSPRRTSAAFSPGSVLSCPRY